MRPWVPLPTRPWLHVTSAQGESPGRELQSESRHPHMDYRRSRAVVQRWPAVRLATTRGVATELSPARSICVGLGQASGVAALH